MKQPTYTKAIELDRAHPYPTARKALNSAITTTIGLALFGGLCCTFCGCFGILFAKRALVSVKDGDFEMAKKLVYASFVCSLGGVTLFALTCVVLVISPIAYVRIVHYPD